MPHKRPKIDVDAFVANANHYHAVVFDTDGHIPKFLELLHRLFTKHQNAARVRWETSGPPNRQILLP